MNLVVQQGGGGGGRVSTCACVHVVAFMLRTCACVHVVGLGTRQGWQIRVRTVVKVDKLGLGPSSGLANSAPQKIHKLWSSRLTNYCLKNGWRISVSKKRRRCADSTLLTRDVALQRGTTIRRLLTDDTTGPPPLHKIFFRISMSIHFRTVVANSNNYQTHLVCKCSVLTR